MDDGADAGEVMWLHGEVKDTEGRPVANAIVDIWHANTLGNYSFFDPARVSTTCAGGSAPAPMAATACAASCPPATAARRMAQPRNCWTDWVATATVRRIHFFVSAPGHKHLTSQINLNGDKYLWDDFAFATRDGLIADPVK